MRSEMTTLTAEYELELKKCGEAQTLEQLQEAYTNVSSMRDELYDYIIGLFPRAPDQDELQRELDELMDLEASLTDKYPFPIFDETADEVALFEEYPTYFQRYGCMDVNYIISWDENSVLFHDVDADLIEIIQRPDVLMRGE
jgi:hypothetical protein